MNFESIDAKSILRRSELLDDREIIDIGPENYEGNPLLFAIGWGKMSESFKRNGLEELAKERRILAFDHKREYAVENIEGHYSVENLQKALTILEAIEKKKIDTVDAIGHSEGGIDLIIAATVAPEKFRNLVLVSPAGMVGRDSFLDLLKRARSEGENVRDKKAVAENIKNSLSYILKNPKMALKETRAIAEADIYEGLKAAKKNGIGIALAFGVDDKIFPMDRVQAQYKNLKEKGEIKNFQEVCDGFYSFKASHDEFSGHSTLAPGVFPEAINIILNDLEKKRVAKNSK